MYLTSKNIDYILEESIDNTSIYKLIYLNIIFDNLFVSLA